LLVAGHRCRRHCTSIFGWLSIRRVWEEQTTVVPLVGNLGQVEARALLVIAKQPQISANKAPRLVFAWTRLDTVPVIFGQMNFFLEFDVCFYRSQNFFDVRLKDNNAADA